MQSAQVVRRPPPRDRRPRVQLLTTAAVLRDSMVTDRDYASVWAEAVEGLLEQVNLLGCALVGRVRVTTVRDTGTTYLVAAGTITATPEDPT